MVLPAQSEYEKWHYFDVEERRWIPINLEFHRNIGYHTLLNAGLIVRKLGEEEEYYIVGKKGELTKVEKRAAYNMAARMLKPRTIGSAVGKHYLSIRGDELGAMPSEIFTLMVRLRAVRVVDANLFVFYVQDLEIIKKLLDLVNISIKPKKDLDEEKIKFKKYRPRPFKYKKEELEILRRKY